jgi:hypothetical protein
MDVRNEAVLTYSWIRDLSVTRVGRFPARGGVVGDESIRSELADGYPLGCLGTRASKLKPRCSPKVETKPRK